MNKKRNIYLDIDGVVITKDGKQANYLEEFLEHIVSTYDCYWLTTHCKGDCIPAMQYLT